MQEQVKRYALWVGEEMYGDQDFVEVGRFADHEAAVMVGQMHRDKGKPWCIVDVVQDRIVTTWEQRIEFRDGGLSLDL
jgi:hypothetical protein